MPPPTRIKQPRAVECARADALPAMPHSGASPDRRGATQFGVHAQSRMCELPCADSRLQPSVGNQPAALSAQEGEGHEKTIFIKTFVSLLRDPGSLDAVGDSGNRAIIIQYSGDSGSQLGFERDRQSFRTQR